MIDFDFLTFAEEGAAERDDVKRLVEDKKRDAVVTGKAPCGHPGEHVIGHYVRCLQGCDGAVPHYVRPEKTLKVCHHRVKYTTFSGRYQRMVDQCADCNEVTAIH